MREPETTSPNLAGSILIAHPALSDPNFRKSVIILSDHDDNEGSLGLILNRPKGKVLGDLLADKRLGRLSRVPVLNGGPVNPEQLIFAAFRWHPQTQRLECRHHIPLEEAGRLAAAQHYTIRAFAGYAGWSAGQLEGELAQRTWLVHKADQQDVLEISRASLIWRELAGTFGPWFKMVADAPDDPSVN